MFYHLLVLANPSNVAMRANNIDSLIIAMAYKQFYDISLKLQIEVGTQSKNTMRYISID